MLGCAGLVASAAVAALLVDSIATDDIVLMFYLGFSLLKRPPWLHWDRRYHQEEDSCLWWRPGLSMAAFGGSGSLQG